jgi:hypothetical protein
MQEWIQVEQNVQLFSRPIVPFFQCFKARSSIGESCFLAALYRLNIPLSVWLGEFLLLAVEAYANKHREFR